MRGIGSTRARRRITIVLSAAATVVVVLLIAILIFRPGLSGRVASSTTTSPAASRSADHSTAAGVPVTTGASPTANRPKTSRVISWISQYTPSGGGGTIPGPIYYDIARDRCDDAVVEAADLDEPRRSLYVGTAAACLAAFHNRPDAWSQAESAAAHLNPNAPEFECFDRDLERLLTALVQFHRDDPDAKVTRQQSNTAGTGCPLIVKITPGQGPRGGGQQVVLSGLRLPSTFMVLFNGDKIGPVSSADGTTATLVTPGLSPADLETTRVGVKIFGSPFDPQAFYTYDAASTSPHASPTGSPSPGPG